MSWKWRYSDRQWLTMFLSAHTVRFQIKVVWYTQRPVFRARMSFQVYCKSHWWYVHHYLKKTSYWVLAGWNSKSWIRCDWCWSRSEWLVCIHRNGYHSARDQCDWSNLQYAILLSKYKYLQLPLELQGHSSSAVIGEMRDALIDNWA